jgi:hypothetical protein
MAVPVVPRVAASADSPPPTVLSAHAQEVADRVKLLVEKSTDGFFTLTSADDTTYMAALKSDIFQLQMSLEKMQV